MASTSAQRGGSGHGGYDPYRPISGPKWQGTGKQRPILERGVEVAEGEGERSANDDYRRGVRQLVHQTALNARERIEKNHWSEQQKTAYLLQLYAKNMSLFAAKAFGQSIDLAMLLVDILVSIPESFRTPTNMEAADSLLAFASVLAPTDEKISGMRLGFLISQSKILLSNPTRSRNDIILASNFLNSIEKIAPVGWKLPVELLDLIESESKLLLSKPNSSREDIILASNYLSCASELAPSDWKLSEELLDLCVTQMRLLLLNMQMHGEDHVFANSLLESMSVLAPDNWKLSGNLMDLIASQTQLLLNSERLQEDIIYAGGFLKFSAKLAPRGWRMSAELMGLIESQVRDLLSNPEKTEIDKITANNFLSPASELAPIGWRLLDETKQLVVGVVDLLLSNREGIGANILLASSLLNSASELAPEDGKIVSKLLSLLWSNPTVKIWNGPRTRAEMIVRAQNRLVDITFAMFSDEVTYLESAEDVGTDAFKAQFGELNPGEIRTVYSCAYHRHMREGDYERAYAVSLELKEFSKYIQNKREDHLGMVLKAALKWENWKQAREHAEALMNLCMRKNIATGDVRYQLNRDHAILVAVAYLRTPMTVKERSQCFKLLEAGVKVQAGVDREDVDAIIEFLIEYNNCWRMALAYNEKVPIPRGEEMEYQADREVKAAAICARWMLYLENGLGRSNEDPLGIEVTGREEELREIEKDKTWEISGRALAAEEEALVKRKHLLVEAGKRLKANLPNLDRDEQVTAQAFHIRDEHYYDLRSVQFTYKKALFRAHAALRELSEGSENRALYNGFLKAIRITRSYQNATMLSASSGSTNQNFSMIALAITSQVQCGDLHKGLRKIFKKASDEEKDIIASLLYRWLESTIASSGARTGSEVRTTRYAKAQMLLHLISDARINLSEKQQAQIKIYQAFLNVTSYRTLKTIQAAEIDLYSMKGSIKEANRVCKELGADSVERLVHLFYDHGYFFDLDDIATGLAWARDSGSKLLLCEGLVRSGEYLVAIRTADEALGDGETEDLASLFYWKGYAHMMMGDVDSARECLEQMDLAEGCREGVRSLAYAIYKLNDEDESAKEVIEREKNAITKHNGELLEKYVRGCQELEKIDGNAWEALNYLTNTDPLTWENIAIYRGYMRALIATRSKPNCDDGVYLCESFVTLYRSFNRQIPIDVLLNLIEGNAISKGIESALEVADSLLEEHRTLAQNSDERRQALYEVCVRILLKKCQVVTTGPNTENLNLFDSWITEAEGIIEEEGLDLLRGYVASTKIQRYLHKKDAEGFFKMYDSEVEMIAGISDDRERQHLQRSGEVAYIKACIFQIENGGLERLEAYLGGASDQQRLLFKYTYLNLLAENYGIKRFDGVCFLGKISEHRSLGIELGFEELAMYYDSLIQQGRMIEAEAHYEDCKDIFASEPGGVILSAIFDLGRGDVSSLLEKMRKLRFNIHVHPLVYMLQARGHLEKAKSDLGNLANWQNLILTLKKQTPVAYRSQLTEYVEAMEALRKENALSECTPARAVELLLQDPSRVVEMNDEAIENARKYVLDFAKEKINERTFESLNEAELVLLMLEGALFVSNNHKFLYNFRLKEVRGTRNGLKLLAAESLEGFIECMHNTQTREDQDGILLHGDENELLDNRVDVWLQRLIDDRDIKTAEFKISKLEALKVLKEEQAEEYRNKITRIRRTEDRFSELDAIEDILEVLPLIHRGLQMNLTEEHRLILWGRVWEHYEALRDDASGMGIPKRVKDLKSLLKQSKWLLDRKEQREIRGTIGAIATSQWDGMDIEDVLDEVSKDAQVKSTLDENAKDVLRARVFERLALFEEDSDEVFELEDRIEGLNGIFKKARWLLRESEQIERQDIIGALKQRLQGLESLENEGRIALEEYDHLEDVNEVLEQINRELTGEGIGEERWKRLMDLASSLGNKKRNLEIRDASNAMSIARKERRLRARQTAHMAQSRVWREFNDRVVAGNTVREGETLAEVIERLEPMQWMAEDRGGEDLETYIDIVSKLEEIQKLQSTLEEDLRSINIEGMLTVKRLWIRDAVELEKKLQKLQLANDLDQLKPELARIRELSSHQYFEREKRRIRAFSMANSFSVLATAFNKAISLLGFLESKGMEGEALAVERLKGDIVTRVKEILPQAVERFERLENKDTEAFTRDLERLKSTLSDLNDSEIEDFFEWRASVIADFESIREGFESGSKDTIQNTLLKLEDIIAVEHEQKMRIVALESLRAEGLSALVDSVSDPFYDSEKNPDYLEIKRKLEALEIPEGIEATPAQKFQLEIFNNQLEATRNDGPRISTLEVILKELEEIKVVTKKHNASEALEEILEVELEINAHIMERLLALVIKSEVNSIVEGLEKLATLQGEEILEGSNGEDVIAREIDSLYRVLRQFTKYSSALIESGEDEFLLSEEYQYMRACVSAIELRIARNRLFLNRTRTQASRQKAKMSTTTPGPSA